MWSLLVPVVGLALAWLVGNQLTDRWDARKKRRELDLSALSEFYRLYGEFFSLWKLWDHALQQGVGTSARREELLDRAAVADGQLEALLVRVSSERKLSADQQHVLGAFRQGYKRVRKAMQNGQSLTEQGWSRSGSTPYAAFKGLASEVAVFLARSQDTGWLKGLWKPVSGPSSPDARCALRQITSNVYESGWLTSDGRQMNVWMAVAVNLNLVGFEEPMPVENSVYYNPQVFTAPRPGAGPA